jgi:serine/threonine protein kinase
MPQDWAGFWPATLTNRFHPRTVLGRGGRSTVLEAVSPDGDVVAVKLPTAPAIRESRDKARRALAREGAVLQRVVHDSIIRLIEASPSGEYLILELLPHGDLADRRRNGRPPLSAAFACAAKLAAALRELHSSGIAHLDVKPRNILLRSDMTQLPVLIDFGSARPISKAIGAGTIACRKLGSGKYRFNAPEQLVRLTSHFTAQTDAFALGATLCWLLTGRRAFSNLTADPSTMRSVYETESEEVFSECRAMGLSAHATHLLRQLLKFDMYERPANLGEAADVLAREII